MITLADVRARFPDCADFVSRSLLLHATGEEIALCWLDGLVRGERLNDYVLHPLSACALPATAGTVRKLLLGGVWNHTVEVQNGLDGVISALLNGSAALFLSDGVVTCAVATEEKRSITPPENETEARGAKDAFVESLRTNTSLLRRRMREPDLRMRELTAGRRTATPIDVLWIDGVTDPALVDWVLEKVGRMDVDALLTVSEVEQGILGGGWSLFPRMLLTERPDRTCRALLDGRVVLLVDGIALAIVLPCRLPDFLKAPQDKSWHPVAAALMLAIRYLCLMVSLVLPAFYIAVACFHFEMIPTQLARSIISAKQDVPFWTQFEVLGLLLAFEILQEAGQRLPKTIGQTVSIIGGLVVGQAAVEAKILSPVVIIVVAVAGITGFTVPDQDLANAMRVWRFLLGIAASVAGLFGLNLALAAMVLHLSAMHNA